MTDQRSEIEDLERRVMSAVQTRDIPWLEQVIAEDFTLTTGRLGAEMRDRTQWMEVTASEYVLETFSFDELVVQLYGDTAVARSRYRQTGWMGDQRRDTTFRMTDVWVRHEQGWKLHVRHAQPIEGD
jgi:ketosteroid isomerase-like protein